MQKFKVGIIGAGAIVESSHLPVLKTLPGVEVGWIYDISEKRKSLLATMYNIPAINEAGLEEAIGSADICLLTIPFGARQSYIRSVAAAGKALYVEKPFALTVNEHREYCSLFRPYQLAVGFQRREYSLVSELAAIIGSGVFGSLRRIDFTQGHFTLKGGKGYLSDARLSGGGVIIESAIHSLDQLLLITAAEKVEVTTLKSLSEKGIDYDSRFTSTLFCSTGNVEVDCRVSTLRNFNNGIRLQFDNAMVHSTTDAKPTVNVTDHKGRDLNFRVTQPVNRGNDFGATTVAQSFALFWKRFINGLQMQQVNITSGQTSLLTTAWVEQVYNRLQSQ